MPKGGASRTSGTAKSGEAEAEGEVVVEKVEKEGGEEEFTAERRQPLYKQHHPARVLLLLPLTVSTQAGTQTDAAC